MATLKLHAAPPPDGETAAADDLETTALLAQPGPRRGRPRTRAPQSRVAYALGTAIVCSVAFLDLMGGEPATATPQSESVAVAAALGISGTGAEADEPPVENPVLLEQLAASRAQRDARQAAAVASQAQAEQAAKAKAEAEARAAAEAAAAAERAAAAAAAAEAEDQAAAAVSAAAGTAVSAIAQINNSAGPLRDVAQAAANAVVSNVPGAANITLGGTRASAADPGGHPSGLAVDYMVMGDAALGDAIVAYHIAHWDELRVDYIIWQQRMLSSPGGSWSMMEDRGSATANHYDHPHVNYRG
ncbi:hypothetical protein [Blastococcus sp. PRF04-17]|uniref:hypothetical protein n=1 Tax=Blastococcus sp. PRF04-17 TaxID=2933797 RepID=UPI001FF1267E|nr:hypothetical protein [Blastococcus sp. PRF04-17]UOY02496.1 hypothetical protein MVA48_03670 [Blastococcus sp. PRF04-17]